jgi:L-aminopeptidase/D-esterase-like protein
VLDAGVLAAGAAVEGFAACEELGAVVMPVGLAAGLDAAGWVTTGLAAVWLAAGVDEVPLLQPVIINAHNNNTIPGINNFFIHSP